MAALHQAKRKRYYLMALSLCTVPVTDAHLVTANADWGGRYMLTEEEG